MSTTVGSSKSPEGGLSTYAMAQAEEELENALLRFAKVYRAKEITITCKVIRKGKGKDKEIQIDPDITVIV